MRLDEWFWRQPRRAGACLLWPKTGQQDDYAGISWQGQAYRVHILAFTLAHGPVPPGLRVRHLCHDKRCVEPTHLAAGTHRDNVADGMAARACYGCGELIPRPTWGQRHCSKRWRDRASQRAARARAKAAPTPA